MVYQNSTVPFEKMLMKFVADDDPMQEMLKWLCERLMAAEVDGKLEAQKSERTQTRQGYRSGYRVRRFDTRMGTMYLMVPKIRNGGYIPFFVEARKRSEAALMNVIQEAYVNGVSTRKIDKLTKSLGIDSISRSQVSAITKELNEQVEAFRNRQLEEAYPVLWVEVLYERIRDHHMVKNMAVLVVTGINCDGKRDVLTIEPMAEESAATYTQLFDNLKARGIKKVWLVVSDAHKGLVKAARESFVGCAWQRCKVHFMRNILANGWRSPAPVRNFHPIDDAHAGRTTKTRSADRMPDKPCSKTKGSILPETYRGCVSLSSLHSLPAAVHPKFHGCAPCHGFPDSPAL